MLDDLKMIHERDKQDALGIAEKQWKQTQYEYPKIEGVDYSTVKNIVFAGMGGSALGAALSTAWPTHDRPFEICRSYNLPGYVGSETLVIASSYSGNTEETIAALAEAQDKSAKIAVIAGGGELVRIAKEQGLPLVVLPEAGQPRFAAIYGLKALISLLVDVGILPAERLHELTASAEFLEHASVSWRTDVATKQNLAKHIALDVIGTTPVIYSSSLFYSAAYKWKISFNENAKNVAWCNQYPEFNHNEFLGWSSHPIDKPYSVIDLRSNLDHPQVHKRFELSARLLSGKRPAPIVVELQGNNVLEQLLWAVSLGDFVSIYTALLNGLNPTPVDLIEKFKKQLVE